MYCDAAKRGLVWHWYYGDVILYSIATALIFHCVSIFKFLKPH